MAGRGLWQGTTGRNHFDPIHHLHAGSIKERKAPYSVVPLGWWRNSRKHGFISFHLRSWCPALISILNISAQSECNRFGRSTYKCFVVQVACAGFSIRGPSDLCHGENISRPGEEKIWDFAER